MYQMPQSTRTPRPMRYVFFGMRYSYTAQQIAGMWSNAVSSNNFSSLYKLLHTANSQQCPIH